MKYICVHYSQFSPWQIFSGCLHEHKVSKEKNANVSALCATLNNTEDIVLYDGLSLRRDHYMLYSIQKSSQTKNYSHIFLCFIINVVILAYMCIPHVNWTCFNSTFKNYYHQACEYQNQQPFHSFYHTSKNIRAQLKSIKFLIKKKTILR